MTPAQQRAEQLDALAKARDLRDMADAVIGTLERVLAASAVTMPPLSEPERPEWLPIDRAAQALAISKPAARQRAQRGLRTGRGRKVAGRLQLHMPSQLEPNER